MIVSVIAGGWSFRGEGWDRTELPGLKIGVNDAGVLLEVDEIVSMDRLWTEGRWEVLKQLGRPSYIRNAALKRLDKNQQWLHGVECDHKSVVMSDSGGQLNGTNSGTFAINRAWQHRPRQIRLYGFDMCGGPKGEAHWYPPYPWAKPTTKLSRAWIGEFRSLATQCKERGIEVLNCSQRSLITAFPKESVA